MLTYTSTKWVNGSGSPLNATNLNNIETGIEALVAAVNTHEGTLESHSTQINTLITVDTTHTTNINSNTRNITNLRNDLNTTNAQVSANETRIDELETTVGNSTIGLVKRVTTLETQSATKAALQGANDKIAIIESTMATDNELANLSTRLSTAEENISALQSGSGSGASTWADISDKPTAFTPTAHAVGTSSTYGAATTSLYGHVKISNGDVANTNHANGLAAGMDHTHSDYATKVEATQEAAGLLSAADKAKLDGIDTEADKTVIVNDLTTESVTSALSAAQGKILKDAIDSITENIETRGNGDMTKARYDTNNNGYVDNADNAVKFDGHVISEFSMDGHKHEISNVNGLQTELNNKADKEHTHDYASKAFKSVVVGDATITADNHEDSLELVAGSNITLTGDATNDKVTISAKDTTYSAGTGISLSGTTFSNSGVRSISESNHKLTVNTGGTTATIDLSYGAAGTSLGLVQSGGDVTIIDGTITVKDDSHNHTIANVDNLQSTLNTLNNMLTWKSF